MTLNSKLVTITSRANKKTDRSMRLLSVIYANIALCLLSITLVGCGGNISNPIPTPTTPPTKVTPTQVEDPTSTFTPTPLVIEGTRIDLDLGEFYIRSNKSSEISGEINFVATNVGAIDHELVIIRTNTPSSSLPLNGAKIDEGNVGEIMARINPEELGAGEYSQVATTLESGVYVLVCNIPGHYSAGMYANLIIN